MTRANIRRGPVGKGAGMYQFDHQDDAIEAARALAVDGGCSVLVMQNTATGRLSIGFESSLGIHQAGAHVATVTRAGRVEPCVKQNWFGSRCPCD